MEDKKEFAPGAVMDLLKDASFVQEDTSGLEQKYAESVKESEEKQDALKNAYKYPQKTRTIIREYKKISRNEKCPCGSGKKYKNCCLSSGKYEQRHEVTVVEQSKISNCEINYSDIQKTA